MSEAAAAPGVVIGLSAVVMALKDGELTALLTGGEGEPPRLPFGPFDPAADRTFERALRAFVERQTGLPLGYVEQLYTFGDAGRDLPRADRERAPRVVSVGYLALSRQADPPSRPDARWSPALACFPWEDWRGGRPGLIDRDLIPALGEWAGARGDRTARVSTLFALDGSRWDEERVLERYELLYEAGLVAEAARDRDLPSPAAAPGLALVSDHRRILATALGRLRAKLKYRPVLFDLTPERFTLSGLQAAAEAVAGLALHKQNFRRGIERTGLVAATGAYASGRGRPAELFRSAAADAALGGARGLALPAQR